MCRTARPVGLRPSLIVLRLSATISVVGLQRVADRRQAAQHEPAVEEVADDALGRQRRLADRDVADEHRVREAAAGDLVGERRVEREAQAVADDRLVQRGVALGERHRRELDVGVADRQLLPVGPADLHGVGGDRGLCAHAGTSLSTVRDPRDTGAPEGAERTTAAAAHDLRRERQLVAARERLVGVRQRPVAVEDGADAGAERSRRRPLPRARASPRSRRSAPRRGRDAHGHARGGRVRGRVVLVGGVDVAQRVAGPGRSAATRGSARSAASSSARTRRRAASARVRQLVARRAARRARGERGAAVGGGERLVEAVGAGEGDVVVGPSERRTRRDERGMQQRRVDAGDEDDRGALADLPQARRRCPRAGRGRRARRRRPRARRAARGSSWPAARTTTTGPSTARATRPTARRTSVEPCHSSVAFGAPMRVERPPARTMPAVRSATERVLERVVAPARRRARSGPPRRPGCSSQRLASSPRSRSRPRSASG